MINNISRGTKKASPMKLFRSSEMESLGTDYLGDREDYEKDPNRPRVEVRFHEGGAFSVL